MISLIIIVAQGHIVQLICIQHPIHFESFKSVLPASTKYVHKNCKKVPIKQSF